MHCLIAMAPGPGLLFGFLLLAAIVGGHAARLMHVPRVVGYLVGGAVLHTILTEVYGHGEQMEHLKASSVPLKAIKDLALGLILFKIGSVFERSQRRAAGSRVGTISRYEIGATTVFIFVACLVVGVATLRDHAIADVALLALLLSLAGIATAPAATLFVLQEYEAKGPITDTILGLTGVNNIVCIVAFYVVFLMAASTGWLQTSSDLSRHIVLAIALTTLGSVALGVLCGVLISVAHARLAMADTMLIFFALFILLGAGEKWLLEHVGLSFNFLLTALTIGGVFANVGIDSQKLNEALRTSGAPIFAGFFALAGYQLHLEDFVHVGWIGLAYIVARLAGKVIGCRYGLDRVRDPIPVRDTLGAALLCQAAVVIGLAAFVDQNWSSPLARRFSTVILGSVVLFELVGPLLVKRCVRLGGEVKLVTLLRRGADGQEQGSWLRLTLQSTLRILGVNDRQASRRPGPLTVNHIMRTNIQFVPASASLDEVLSFIERSTFSHFPVRDEKGELVGVIHFSDVRDVIYDPTLRGLVTAIDLADTNSPIVDMDMPLTELLKTFHDANVAVLPVRDKPGSRKVVGLVEQRDLLNALHRAPHVS